MSILDNYRKRVGLGKSNLKEKLTLQSEMTFERMLNESPSSLRLKATVPGEIDILNNLNEIDGIIQNISDNDIKSFDQKYLLVRHDENFDIGCYIEYDDTYWLAIFREHKTVKANKKFTMAKCNNIWKYKKNGIVYQFPIFVQNLSLYSDGLADNKYTSQEDGKVSMFYGENPITKSIDINTRVMISGRNTFRMTNINDYEFRSAPDKQCAIKAMMLQTTILDKDDLENNIAWNKDSEIENIPSEKPVIVGNKSVIIGSKHSYDSSIGIPYRHWDIECSSELKKSIVFEKPGMGDKNCTLKFPSNAKFVGESVILKMYASNVLKDTLEIRLRGI